MEMVIAVVAVIFGQFMCYLAGKYRERLRYSKWMEDGWQSCIDHLEWLQLTREEDPMFKHAMFMAETFGRKYPDKRKKIK